MGWQFVDRILGSLRGRFRYSIAKRAITLYTFHGRLGLRVRYVGERNKLVIRSKVFVTFGRFVLNGNVHPATRGQWQPPSRRHVRERANANQVKDYFHFF